MSYLQMTDDKLEEQDPETGLFPFMLRAAGESDLYSVFCLLRKNPGVLKKQRGLVKESIKKRNKKKRKVNTKKISSRMRSFFSNIRFAVFFIKNRSGKHQTS
jgi:hypothetical protein